MCFLLRGKLNAFSFKPKNVLYFTKATFQLQVHTTIVVEKLSI